MKAAVIKTTGGPNVIEWTDFPKPEIQNPDDVLIKVSTAAVNHLDGYFRSGKYPLTAGSTFPYVLGTDVVGTVAHVGEGVTSLKIGQQVWSNSLGVNGRQGSYAEYVVASESMFYPVPAGVDDLTIASVIQSGITGCVGLIRIAMLKTSDVVFVDGGAGNVGSAVIQLVRARGARVITSSTGSEKIEWCQKIGAEAVFDYQKENIEQKIKELFPDGVNVFWGTSRQHNFDMIVNSLAFRGKIILMAGAGSHSDLPIGPFYHKELSLQGFTIMSANSFELAGAADIINRCLEEGRLKSKVAHVLPMSQAAQAHTLLETDKNLWGKILLKF